ncbi:unnamed protein product [Heligmosomoides polygyrus]|uniref:G protein-coupled receptor n=1 Tax=Heligmosomoides polygyrus TaxID=6339 RepID=A0A183FP53_HELPZ|nr:unnamed protein product [Heligmosomoides polygyrus]
MHENTVVICQAISSLSLLANFYLFYLYLRCPVRNLDAYKHFFLATAIQDLLFSTCFILIVPITVSRDFAFVLLAYGPLRERAEGMGLLAFYCVSFASSMVMVMDSFIYRYLQICKSQIFDDLLCRRNVILGLICNAFIIAFSLSVVWTVLWPTPSLDMELDNIILLNSGLHAQELALVGVSLKGFDALTFTMFLFFPLLMLTVGAVISWAAYTIHTTLKNSLYSSKQKELHRKMFVLLLLQTACPFGFLHAPCLAIFSLFFGGVTSTPFVASICSILMASFPLFCPIIIIVFLENYRRQFFVLLHIFDVPENSEDMSNTSTKVSGDSEDVPKTLSNVLWDSEDVPNTLSNVTGDSEDVPKTSPNVGGRTERCKAGARTNTTKKMYQEIAVICQAISSLSLLANFYLLYLYLRCPVRNLNAYKHFFLATALQDLLFSTCIILLAPITLSRDFAFVFLAYGPLRERAEGLGLMMLFCMAFASSMVLVTDSFIYRYVQVCKIVFWPTPSLDEELGAIILDNTGLRATELAIIGVSMKTFTVLTFTLFIALVLLMSALAAIISWAAFKIHTTLKKAIYSSRLKELHRQMFVLLLLQSACPFCFLHAPCFLVYILFFGGVTSTPFLTSICSILMASFPLFSPIIIIAFLKEYRRFALVSLRIYRPTSEVSTISVFPSQRGPTTIDWPQ